MLGYSMQNVFHMNTKKHDIGSADRNILMNFENNC